jgi:SAM-dependent methyltransferase
MTKYKLTPNILKPLIINNSNKPFVPQKILRTVQTSIKSSISDINKAISSLKMWYNLQQNNIKIIVDYNDPVLLEAYLADYFLRNTLVPKIGLLLRSYHPKTLITNDRIRILDLGSGTGAIPIGLLDLFQQPSLSSIKCDILSIDSSIYALAKQEDVINEFGLKGSTHRFSIADLNDPATYSSVLQNLPSFDLIFLSNILSELDSKYIANILKIIQDKLTPEGTCIIAESQNTPAKRACANVTKNISKYGLNLFFPCPPQIKCVKSECWKWFNISFDCPNLVIGSTPFKPTKNHKLFWRIITKQDSSIFDYFNSYNNNVSWGITCYYTQKECNEFCTEQGHFEGTIMPPIFSSSTTDPWSQIIGTTLDQQKILLKWDFIRDFEKCNYNIGKNQ